MFTWWDDRDDGYGTKIYLQRFSDEGSLIDENFQTTTKDTIMVQTFEDDPSIIVDNDGNFLVFWYDKRQEAGIYVQKYTSNGSPIDTNIKLDQALSTNIVSNDNRILIVDRKTTDNQIQQIFGQMCSFDGVLSDSIFQISDDSTIIKYSTPAVSKLGINNFIVTWQDQRNGAYDIYARRINENGIALENSFKVNDDIGSNSDPCVTSNTSSKFLIAWTDQSHEVSSAIYAQLYSSEGVAINSNFKISTNTGGEVLRNTTVTAIGNDNFVIVWTDYTNKDIYAQIVSGGGALIGTNFQVGAGPGNRSNPPSLASDEAGNFIIAWNDNRNQNWPDDPWEIFAQRFDSDGSTLGSVFKVTNNINLPFEYEPNIQLFNNKIYTTWPERDRFDLGTGVDIWANVLDWDNPVTIRDNISEPLPVKFQLHQNYPNPFNPITNISYVLPITCHLELSIYNILGQKVATLVNKRQSAGNYNIEWDASGLVSGVYYYQLQAGDFLEVKKMVLLK
jgi:hypothetical protein